MTLLFIYNANSGKLNALFDAGHKLLNPSTYPCSLCTLTYDTFSENVIWKKFRKENNSNMKFLHKDEFEIKFPKTKITYPAILKLDKNKLVVILNNQTLNKINDLDVLIKLIENEISNN